MIQAIRTLQMLALGLAMFAGVAANAEAPNGSFRVDPGVGELVRIFEGDFDTFILADAFCRDIKSKPRGSFSGKCDVRDLGAGRLDGKVKGSVEREGDKTVLREELKAKGRTPDGRGGRADFTLEVDIKIVAKDGERDAAFTVRAKVCVDKQCGKSKNTLRISSLILRGSFVERDWVIDMDVDTDASNAVSGTATVSLIGSKPLVYNVKGSHDPATDTSRLKFKPSKKAKGTQLKLTNTVVQGGVLSGDLRYDIFGNSGRTEVGPGGPARRVGDVLRRERIR